MVMEVVDEQEGTRGGMVVSSPLSRGWRKGVREWEVGNGWKATSLEFSGIGPYLGSKWTKSYMGFDWTAQSSN